MKYEIGDLIRMTNLKHSEAVLLVVGVEKAHIDSGGVLRYSKYKLLDPVKNKTIECDPYYIEDNNWEVVNGN